MLREVKIGRWSEGDRGEAEMVGLICVTGSDDEVKNVVLCVSVKVDMLSQVS